MDSSQLKFRMEEGSRVVVRGYSERGSLVRDDVKKGRLTRWPGGSR